MADSFTLDADASGIEAALRAFGDDCQPFINVASKVTADAIVTEARARLERQLGSSATGKTAAGITNRPAYDGNGYVVVVERDPMPSLPFWIEKGTKQGKPGSHTESPRPFFYVSALLEVNAHQRRLSDALQQASAAKGLGDV